MRKGWVGSLHTELGKAGGVQAAPRDSAQQISATHLATSMGRRSPVGLGRGDRTSALRLQAECGRARAREPQEPHGMYYRWTRPRLNMHHMGLHQH